MKTILEAHNLSFTYFENVQRAILENVSLLLEEGTVTLLRGKSGCGKSTLAHILAGLYPENGGRLLSGSVLIDGTDIHALGAHERVQYVGMLFQNADLQFCMDTLRNELLFCAENLTIAGMTKISENKKKGEITDFFAKNRFFVQPIDSYQLSAEFEDVIQKIGIFHLLDRKFSELSGGEKQKCAFCCVLALKSRVLILDEAFANVDFESARELAALIRQRGLTVLAVDHNADIWEGLNDRVIFLDNEQNVEFFPLKLVQKTGKIVLQTKKVRIFGIEYPDMSFEEGCITAVLGKSGCGKTTLFCGIIGKNRYEGRLLLDEKEVRSYKKADLYAKCGLVFQNPANQFLTMRVFDEVFFSVFALIAGNKHTFFAKKSEAEAQKSSAMQKTNELLKLFSLEAYAKYPPYLLSQGQQRRLAVLTMLAGGQKVLLLDEPTYGQDFENILMIMRLLEERAQNGLTVVFNTHSKKTATAFADKIIYLT